MKERAPFQILCGGARLDDRTSSEYTVICLESLKDISSRNVRIGLPKFVENVGHLPARMLDLLEIAAWVYCADRRIGRGAKDMVEYSSWSRRLLFHIPVRDHAFWSQPSVRAKLSAALQFLGGDRRVDFDFKPGGGTPPMGLFDAAAVPISLPSNAEIILFSGGLDSLAGVVQQLATSSSHLILVSHRSGSSATIKTQKALVRALSRKYPGRIEHFPFECGLTGDRADEESQRTRFFLYATIAFVLGQTADRNHVFVYENGITSLNFPKRQDLINARASRTTHPQTIFHLEEFFSEVANQPFRINTPFFPSTKSEVVQTLAHCGGQDLISSAVSCSKTFERGNGTHCGFCSQCVDRRFAIHAANLQDFDEGIYGLDFINEPVVTGEAKTNLVDYIRQAETFASQTQKDFYVERASDLIDVVDYSRGLSEERVVGQLYDLCRRHGVQVLAALDKMRKVGGISAKDVAVATVERLGAHSAEGAGSFRSMARIHSD